MAMIYRLLMRLNRRRSKFYVEQLEMIERHARSSPFPNGEELHSSADDIVAEALIAADMPDVADKFEAMRNSELFWYA